MVRSTDIPVATLSKPKATTLSTDGSNRRRNPLTYLFRASSRVEPNHAPVPKSIHAQLGCEIQAYAVFKPRMSDLFELFHILHITDGSDSNRHKSPVYTVANFKTICEEMRADAHDGDLETVEMKVLDKLCYEMKKVDKKDNQESPILGIATASSVENAVSFHASVGVPNALSVGTTLTKNRTALREFSLTVTETEKYCGGNKLNRLIWKNGQVLFMKIIEELGGDGNISIMGVGQRKLIVIVTKKIMADINIARERIYVREFGSHAAGLEGTFNALLNVNKSRVQRDNSHHEGGITGIHFIEFPMERIDDFKFRFLPGINVGPVGDDESDGTNPDAFSMHKRWLQDGMQGEDRVQSGLNRYHDRNGMDAGLNGASMNKEIETGAMRRREAEAKYIDCMPELNCVPLEVDLTPGLYEFSMNQARKGRECYIRAKTLCSSVDDGLLARSVNFFRSALRTVCYEATLYGLDGLSSWNQGSCEEKRRTKGKLLRYCWKMLRQGEESWEVWKRLLGSRRKLIEDPKPEMRIAEMICLVSNGPRRKIWDGPRGKFKGWGSRDFASEKAKLSQWPPFCEMGAKLFYGYTSSEEPTPLYRAAKYPIIPAIWSMLYFLNQKPTPLVEKRDESQLSDPIESCQEAVFPWVILLLMSVAVLQVATVMRLFHFPPDGVWEMLFSVTLAMVVSYSGRLVQSVFKTSNYQVALVSSAALVLFAILDIAFATSGQWYVAVARSYLSIFFGTLMSQVMIYSVQKLWELDREKKGVFR